MMPIQQYDREVPLSLADLLAQDDLGLAELHRGAGADRPISWASSSDLRDPTPFLVADQLLLTTGQQFAEDAGPAAFDAYVERLRRRDVLGIGFGTEVARNGTPAGLVDACRAADLALVEVPYRTPFLAIIRRVAHELERAARARDDWALAASRAISGAALPRGDVSAVLAELAARLGARVLLFDADGELERAHPRARASDPAPELADAARRLLAAGVRAATELGADDGSDTAATLLQTIGPADELAGVLAVTGPRPDRAARTVLASAIALVEVGVAESRRAARGDLARDAVLVRLLREGRADLAAGIAEAADSPLPSGPVAVVATSVPRPEARRALAEREAQGAGRLVLVEGELVVLVIGARAAAGTASRLARWGHAVGTAGIDGLADLDVGIARAEAAHRRADVGIAVAWEDLPAPSDLGGAAEVAAALLAPIAATPAGAAEIEAATAWFAENCSWGGAARRLGLHPHTVRDRVASLGGRLDVDLGDFAGRARLWTLLESR
jgi:PucR family transcriptional regulator, purine catabolism regulatory protein